MPFIFHFVCIKSYLWRPSSFHKWFQQFSQLPCPISTLSSPGPSSCPCWQWFYSRFFYGSIMLIHVFTPWRLFVFNLMEFVCLSYLLLVSIRLLGFPLSAVSNVLSPELLRRGLLTMLVLRSMSWANWRYEFLSWTFTFCLWYERC